MRLRRLEPVLRRALRGPCAMPRDSHLLVAVSGGADSTALLVALSSLAREFALSIHAAHLHHGLRGADADEDLLFVRALCGRLGVPLDAARWNTRARMRRAGLSGEAGLRSLRRRFLLEAARRAGAAGIATAHTADDQLETLLMRLARGTALAGLGGMRPRHGAWLKPLLGATRFDVERDLRAARIEWRKDASNATRAYARNRVRLDVVPALLAAVEPGAGAKGRAALALRAERAAASARSGAAVAARLARAELRRRLAPGSLLAFDARGLAAVPEAVREALLSLLWKLANPASTGLPRLHRDAITALACSRKRVARVALPDGWRAVARDGRLEFVPPGAGARARGAAGSGADPLGNARLRAPTGTPRA